MTIYKEIDLIQGSEPWLDYRRSHIMATDTAIICGKSPYKTPLQLYTQKIEGTQNPVNAAMKRGNEGEEEAREFLKKKLGKNLKPIVCESLEFPYMGASLDAVTDDGLEGIEIKRPGEKVMRNALNGEIGDLYIYQCQKQILVMGWKAMSLSFYIDEDINCTYLMKRDEKIQAEIKKKEAKFFECLKNRIPPDLEMKDYVEIEDEDANILAMKIMNLQLQQKHVKDELELAKDELKRIAGEQATKFSNANVKMLPYFGGGTVDYKKICTDLEVEDEVLEKYRRPKTICYKFSMY